MPGRMGSPSKWPANARLEGSTRRRARHPRSSTVSSSTVRPSKIAVVTSSAREYIRPLAGTCFGMIGASKEPRSCPSRPSPSSAPASWAGASPTPPPSAGFRTILHDVSADALERALSAHPARPRRGHRARQAHGRRRRRRPEAPGAGAGAGSGGLEADFVIEAVPEEIDLKLRTFERLDERCGERGGAGHQHLGPLHHRDRGGHARGRGAWWACTSSTPCPR